MLETDYNRMAEQAQEVNTSFPQDRTQQKWGGGETPHRQDSDGKGGNLLLGGQRAFTSTGRGLGQYS